MLTNSRIVDDASSLRLYSSDQGDVPERLRRRVMADTTPSLVIQPGSLHDLQRVVRYTRENEIPLVPRGASTFGMGGAVPHQGGILLDFSTYRKISKWDEAAGTLRVSAGCRWPDAAQFLESRGMDLCS